MKAAELDAAAIGQNRAMQMPGKVWSIDQVIAAMTAVAGPEPAKLIRWEAQPDVQAIVSGWRWDIHADKAERAGAGGRCVLRGQHPLLSGGR